jgi:adenylate kinase
MQDLMLFGVQGSGKGTQGKILAAKHGYKIFETGGELRRLSKEDSELGKRIKNIIEGGALVDDATIMDIVENFLKNTEKERAIIFDGLPRRLSQMELFEVLMKKYERKPVCLHIKLTKEEALKRLLARFTCEGVDMSKNPLMTEAQCIALGGKVKRRADDTEEAILKRLNIFDEETMPVISAYKKEDRCLELEGNQELDAVTVAIEELI